MTHQALVEQLREDADFLVDERKQVHPRYEARHLRIAHRLREAADVLTWEVADALTGQEGAARVRLRNVQTGLCYYVSLAADLNPDRIFVPEGSYEAELEEGAAPSPRAEGSTINVHSWCCNCAGTDVGPMLAADEVCPTCQRTWAQGFREFIAEREPPEGTEPAAPEREFNVTEFAEEWENGRLVKNGNYILDSLDDSA